LHFDEDQGYNRALRYATNQKSPFEDEQDGNVVLAPVVFMDGLLHVPANNQALQHFLSLHPLLDIKFEEVNNEKTATIEVANLDMEVDALIEARGLSLEMMETVGRILFDVDTSLMTTSELKRDILVYAKRSPQSFLTVVSDPQLVFNGAVASFLDHKVITWRNNQKEVYFNTPSNKKRMMAVPFGDDPMVALQSYFKTDEGLEQFDALQALIS
tara:strand:+ start:557 stop:1198 length:642 start_codon:yes stop_codon:yes gene_type:complete